MKFDPRIAPTDSPRTARLKLIYLLPAAILYVPVVGLLAMVGAVLGIPGEVRTAWRQGA